MAKMEKLHLGKKLRSDPDIKVLTLTFTVIPNLKRNVYCKVYLSRFVDKC